VLLRDEGGGQGGGGVEEEGAESGDGEKDSEDGGPPLPPYALRGVRGLAFLLHCDGVLLRWRLALPSTQPP